MSVARGVGAAYTPNYTMDQILQATRGTQQSSGFRRVLGGVVGTVGNIFMPGVGGAIGNMIAGGSLNSSGLLGESTQFLELQRSIQMESRAFETASAVMKSRHDASMAAIRNLK
jgi:hypothetical protein